MIQQNITIAIIVLVLFVAVVLALYYILLSQQSPARSPPPNGNRALSATHTPSLHNTETADSERQIRLRDDVAHGPVRQRPEPAHLRR